MGPLSGSPGPTPTTAGLFQETLADLWENEGVRYYGQSVSFLQGAEGKPASLSGLIYLASRAYDKTLNHELFHQAVKFFLSPREYRILRNKFKTKDGKFDEERAANAYRDLANDQQLIEDYATPVQKALINFGYKVRGFVGAVTGKSVEQIVHEFRTGKIQRRGAVPEEEQIARGVGDVPDYASRGSYTTGKPGDSVGQYTTARFDFDRTQYRQVMGNRGAGHWEATLYRDDGVPYGLVRGMTREEAEREARFATRDPYIAAEAANRYDEAQREPEREATRKLGQQYLQATREARQQQEEIDATVPGWSEARADYQSRLAIPFPEEHKGNSLLEAKHRFDQASIYAGQARKDYDAFVARSTHKQDSRGHDRMEYIR